MTAHARRIASIPRRGPIDTWRAICDLLCADADARAELDGIGGVAAALIAKEYTSEEPIVVSGTGPQVRFYTLHGDRAIEADLSEELPLSHDPTAGSWVLSLPCAADDLADSQAAVAGASHIEVRALGQALARRQRRPRPPPCVSPTGDRPHRSGGVVTSVVVNVHTQATTHVAANVLRSIRQIIKGCGLSTTKMLDQWAVLEAGVATWLQSGGLEALILEVYDPSDRLDDRRGRFDFTIDYAHYGDGDGELWLDPETVRRTILKNGSYPSACDYRFVATTSSGRPNVDGWSTATLRSTAGFERHTVGTAVGGGNLGGSLAYYRRSS